MEERMGGWMSWMDELDGWIHGMDELDSWMDGKGDRLGGWLDGQVGVWMDGWMDAHGWESEWTNEYAYVNLNFKSF